MIKVSVIIPVYNAGMYLEKCLESVMGQTLRDIEIICIDDGSTDKSWEILKSARRRDGRIRIARQKNMSAGAARNKGLEAASGEYLAFLDADDFFEYDMLARAYKRAKEKRADIVVYRSDQYDQKQGMFCENGGTVNERYLPGVSVFSHKDVRDDFFGCFAGWAWDKLFNREFVLKNGVFFQEQKSINDLYFVYSMLAKADRITVLQRVLAHKRVNNEGSISMVYSESKTWPCFYFALLKLKRQLEEWGIYEELKRDYVNYALYFSLWNLNKFFATENYSDLYTSLRGEWLERMDVLGNKGDYYYRQEDYNRLEQIVLSDALQYKKHILYISPDINFMFPCGIGDKAVKIIIYGAGRIGQKCYQAIENHQGFCICGWIDRYKAGTQCLGYLLDGIQRIRETAYDYILIAVKNSDLAESIENSLEQAGARKGRFIRCNP